MRALRVPRQLGEWYVPDKVYLFSLEKGFLMLRQDLRARHDIVATNVTVPIWDDCFGTPLRSGLWYSRIYRGELQYSAKVEGRRGCRSSRGAHADSVDDWLVFV
jgi:hypothetical protein